MANMGDFGLDPNDPIQEAAFLIGSGLKDDGQIVELDLTFLIVLIEILNEIVPILEQYCPQEDIVSNANSLGLLGRVRWRRIIRSRVVRSMGRSAWSDVGGNAFANQAIKLTAENPNNIVNRALA